MKLNGEVREGHKAPEEGGRGYHDLADLLPQIVMEIAPDGRILYLNRKGREFSGITDHDLAAGLDAFSFLLPEERRRAQESLRRILAGEKDPGGTYTVVARDGRRITALIHAAPVLEGSVLKGFRMTCTDITTLKQIETALRESEERFARIAVNIPGVIFQFSVLNDGTMGNQYVSERSRDLPGIDNDPSDFFKRFTASVDPRDREAFLASVDTAVRHKRPWAFEGRFIRPSGDMIWIRGASDPERTTQGLVY